MRIHLVNPSDVSFGTAVITPRWQYVLAAATPARHGTPLLVDETLEPMDEDSVQAGDVVGIGIHTGNALRGYRIGQDRARARRLRRVRRHSRDAVPGRSARAWRRSRRGHRRRRSRLADGPRRLRSGEPAAALRRRARRRRVVLSRALGSAAERSLHVGVGPDRARLPEALLVLLGVAHRWAEAAPARRQPRRARDRPASPPGLPLHRPRRRQLLSGDAGGPCRRRSPRRQEHSTRR